MHSIFLILIIALLSVQNIYCVCPAQNIQPIYGIQTDVPIGVFSGLTIAYQQPYLDATTSAVLQVIKSNCLADSIACVGCYLTGQNVVHVAACGNCKAIFTETTTKLIHQTLSMVFIGMKRLQEASVFLILL